MQFRPDPRGSNRGADGLNLILPVFQMFDNGKTNTEPYFSVFLRHREILTAEKLDPEELAEAQATGMIPADLFIGRG